LGSTCDSTPAAAPKVVVGADVAGAGLEAGAAVGAGEDAGAELGAGAGVLAAAGAGAAMVSGIGFPYAPRRAIASFAVL
jgi:hypothetical protein